MDYVFLNEDSYCSIGQGSYHNGAIVLRWTNAHLSIGNYCSIARGVNFIIDEGYHKGSKITSYPFINNLSKEESELEIKNSIKQRKGIEVGNDVWIGINATILPGTKIGNGVTVGANAVVSGNIPDYSIVVGSPAKIIKYKFTKEQISDLNKIAWWFWDKETLKSRKKDFYKLNINDFINKYI